MVLDFKEWGPIVYLCNAQKNKIYLMRSFLMEAVKTNFRTWDGRVFEPQNLKVPTNCFTGRLMNALKYVRYNEGGGGHKM